MKKQAIAALALLAAAIVIGCGGEGNDLGSSTSSTSTTSSTSSTSTTSTTGSAFEGVYRGPFSGSNTTGARFNGTGEAEIKKNGSARFEFDALIDGVVSYRRRFNGHVDDEGDFEGTTNTGEATSGTVVQTEAGVNATLVWQKRDIDGHVFYTETENFTLNREPTD